MSCASRALRALMSRAMEKMAGRPSYSQAAPLVSTSKTDPSRRRPWYANAGGRPPSRMYAMHAPRRAPSCTISRPVAAKDVQFVRCVAGLSLDAALEALARARHVLGGDVAQRVAFEELSARAAEHLERGIVHIDAARRRDLD